MSFKILIFLTLASLIKSGYIDPNDKWYEVSIIPSLSENDFFQEVS